MSNGEDVLSLSDIKGRVLKSFIGLLVRQLIVTALPYITTDIILAPILPVETIGVFNIAIGIVGFFTFFSDIGLAASLIQKKEAITKEDIRTTFTIQQIIVGTLSLIIIMSAPFFANFYHLDNSGVWLIAILGVAFFLSSLKVVPSVLLERELNFTPIVTVEIIENIVFSAVLVFFAFNNYNIWSFSIAALVRGVLGVVLIYILAPTKVSFGIDRAAAKKLLSFGLPFQLNSLLALIKDDLLIVYLGKVLPLAQVGYIGFAQKWALMPLRLIMDNVIRITFPSFSRLQDEKEVLTKAIEKSIFAACFAIFPALVGLVILAPYFVHLIPKYIKWEPALLSLFFFSINAALSSISTPLTNALNAIGKIKSTLYLMVFWTISTWVLTPLLIVIYGFNGVAIASALISTSVVIVIFIVKRYLVFSILNSIFYPALSSLIMGIILYLLAGIFAKNLYGLLACIILGAIIYVLTIYILAKEQIKADMLLIRQSIRR